MATAIETLVSAFNNETNALAALIDAFEMAEGSTVSRATMQSLKAISARLKDLGTVEVPSTFAADLAPVLEPALATVKKSVAPKAPAV